MAESINRGLARRLREESDRSKDAPYPAGTTGSCPNRDRPWDPAETTSSRNRIDVRADQDEEREGDTCDPSQGQQSHPTQPGTSDTDE